MVLTHCVWVRRWPRASAPPPPVLPLVFVFLWEGCVREKVYMGGLEGERVSHSDEFKCIWDSPRCLVYINGVAFDEGGLKSGQIKSVVKIE